jgi:hypothetical protein
VTLSADDLTSIRSVLAGLDPKSAASAARPIAIAELYAPPTHSRALSFDAPLVVGNRGAGKSVWSGALADETTRLKLTTQYKELGLERMVVDLGFHEDAGKVAGVAPSPAVLSSLLSDGVDAEQIWTAVLLRSVGPMIKLDLPASLKEIVAWSRTDPERAEAALRRADENFGSNNQRFLLVFDALDRLASNWGTIRPLTQGILRLALSMFGFQNMHAKVFLRTDQEGDEALFNFPDASKLRALAIRLAWHASELYGLLFSALERDAMSRLAFKRCVRDALRSGSESADFDDSDHQRAIFSLIAGEFMGTDHRRGRTYTWIIDHLADAFHETTPRSFLIALQRAASTRAKPQKTVIDHHGVREGVQAASAVRVDQLGEDYPWIQTLLGVLAGLEVPCRPDAFLKRWKTANTVGRVNDVTKRSGRPGPIGLEGARTPGQGEQVLLDALKSIGVIEERSADRINMPDLFRVAAKIKRRGGVRPPTNAAKHA